MERQTAHGGSPDLSRPNALPGSCGRSESGISTNGAVFLNVTGSIPCRRRLFDDSTVAAPCWPPSELTAFVDLDRDRYVTELRHKPDMATPTPYVWLPTAFTGAYGTTPAGAGGRKTNFVCRRLDAAIGSGPLTGESVEAPTLAPEPTGQPTPVITLSGTACCR